MRAAIPSGLFVHIICISVHCSSYQLLNTASDGPPRILPGGKNGPSHSAVVAGLFVHIICISVHCSPYQLNTACDGHPRISSYRVVKRVFHIFSLANLPSWTTLQKIVVINRYRWAQEGHFKPT